MRARKGRACALAIAILAVMASCNTSKPSSAPVPEPVVKGGTLVVGAFQEPACADWLAACGNSSSGFDMMANQTLPRPLDLVSGDYRPGAVLAGEPTLEPGPPQRVTYRIDPKAVWSDGQPIDASDFRYTAEQIRATTPAATFIDSVDDQDPKAAVVTFRQPTAAWRDSIRFVFPQHLLANL